MNIGISSSCFYPLETEKAIIRLGELGVKTAEVFFNSPSELEREYLKKICTIKDSYGMDIVSFHPYMSFAEGFFIFSSYKRRFYDSLEMYKPFFEAAATIGARYFILHGSKSFLEIDREEYAERYSLFNQMANRFGICVAHENVVDYVGQSPEFMSFMKNTLGDEFKMTIDVKQARRAGVDPFDFIKEVGKSIVHLHLSDCLGDELCLPPSPQGSFDFKRLFCEMNELGYGGKYIIELYRRNFTEDNQLKRALDYLSKTENDTLA